MRDWFNIGCKLLGMYYIYLALTSALGSLSFFVNIGDTALSETDRNEMLLIYAFAIVAEVGFAFPLLFKTEWLADTLKVREGHYSTWQDHGSRQLQLGITLIGIYSFCANVGRLAGVYAKSRQTNYLSEPFVATQPKGLSFSIDFVDPVVTIVISMLLIFGAKYIAPFLTKEKQPKAEHL